MTGVGGGRDCPDHGVPMERLDGNPLPGHDPAFRPRGWSCPVDPGHPPGTEQAAFVTPCHCGEGYGVPWPDHEQNCPWFVTEGTTPQARDDRPVGSAAPQCGEPGYERCPECQAHRTERHLDPCSLRPRTARPDGPDPGGSTW